MECTIERMTNRTLRRLGNEGFADRKSLCDAAGWCRVETHERRYVGNGAYVDIELIADLAPVGVISAPWHNGVGWCISALDAVWCYGTPGHYTVYR